MPIANPTTLAKLSYLREPAEKQNERAKQLLGKTRQQKAQDSHRPYNSTETREAVTKYFDELPDLHVTPYHWQAGHATIISVRVFVPSEASLSMLPLTFANGYKGGLLLGGLAAWLTTPPPVATRFDYSTRGPYICLLVSFAFTWGGLIAGSVLLYTIPMCTGSWFFQTLMGTRSHVCCTLLLITYPFLSMGFATAVGTIGLLLAAWNSEDNIIRIGCAFVVLVPASLAFVGMWTQRYLVRDWVLNETHSRTVRSSGYRDHTP
ncbi:uncharacterized protein STEHIDRAFT_108221 [Stereum hirsutum FP-91666 SS1]|uniref:uncharacterized protein n=1 Tax=Stereum hirsutum (strain FP-91666) TaxID=721885 RepID=UPI000440FF2E|nr:uncharacterized protein STEHIDRAFT_108221 [Stereum hirsutum FP-91666 SS1]EIM89499.1 hypothetical protein STEHIDRAFT_108221 [Stereum hirsutum FP-91666 SS1]